MDNLGGELGMQSLSNSRMLPFPLKLHIMLDQVTKHQSQNEDHIISWQSHGRAFRVYNPNKFEKLIIPLYFKQTKYKSFQRQLQIYGFHRIKTGTDKGAFFHKFFIRDEPTLALQIDRRSLKSDNKVITKSSASQVSDEKFYASVIHLSQKKNADDASTKELYGCSTIHPSTDVIPSDDPIPFHDGIQEMFCVDADSSSYISPETIPSINHHIIPYQFLIQYKHDRELNNTRTGTEALNESYNINALWSFGDFHEFDKFEKEEQASFEGKKYFFVDEACRSDY